MEIPTIRLEQVKELSNNLLANREYYIANMEAEPSPQRERKKRNQPEPEHVNLARLPGRHEYLA